jgi:UDP-N-acetylmuramoyl-L-alanyl-D-glutamate--2,6-diaminopimelate ligase
LPSSVPAVTVTKQNAPIIGKIASELCDVVIVTDDEPYFEDPQQIREMIVKGVEPKNKDKVTVINDRREAIKHALKIAKPHDIVMIMGMGNETSRVIKDKTIPWNEREVIKELANH